MAEGTKRDVRDPIVTKMIVVAVLIVGLLIPIEWIDGLVHERRQRHAEVRREVSATWGGEQLVQGPVLILPYVERRQDEKGKETVWRRRAYSLPEQLEIDGVIEPETRARGIFEVLLYRVRLRIRGTFAAPDFGSRPVAPEDVAWEDATLSIGIPDLRGMESDPKLEWNGTPVAFRPGAGSIPIYASGMNATVPGVAATGGHRFSFSVSLTGTDALRFVPVGKDNRVTLASSWPDPSFDGAFLPLERSVRTDGFDASWRVSYYGRSFPQSWRSDDSSTAPRAEALAAAAFGVRLLESIDFYRKTERATKYAVLFLALTFLAFLLFETWTRLRVHPLPYLLVGLSLCLFFVLLLSLAEHLGFALAYALAASGTIAVIAGYASRLLAGTRRGALLAGGLAGLYGWLYVLLQIEDYALLLGSLGLFVALAAVMYATRGLDGSGEITGARTIPAEG
jgi:inner membrane protein